MKGFKQYGSLLGVHYVEAPEVENKQKDVVSPADKVLDLIFSLDSNGWPNTSVEVMLSTKTSEEVRKFISDNLLGARDTAHVINDPSVINEFNKLESDFIAQCSRNRFESIEHYEERLQTIIKDSETANLIRSFHERIKNVDLK